MAGNIWLPPFARANLPRQGSLISVGERGRAVAEGAAGGLAEAAEAPEAGRAGGPEAPEGAAGGLSEAAQAEAGRRSGGRGVGGTSGGVHSGRETWGCVTCAVPERPLSSFKLIYTSKIRDVAEADPRPADGHVHGPPPPPGQGSTNAPLTRVVHQRHGVLAGGGGGGR